MSVFRISERQTDMCFSYSYRKLKTLFEKRKKTNHNGMCEEILSVNTRAMEENKAGYSEFVVRTGLHHCFPEICLSNPFFVFCCCTGFIISELTCFKGSAGTKGYIDNILKFKLLVVLQRKKAQWFCWGWVEKSFSVLQCQAMYACPYTHVRGYILLREIIISIIKFYKLICLYVWYKFKVKWYKKSQLLWQTPAMK